jgi:hypothetical protein
MYLARQADTVTPANRASQGLLPKHGGISTIAAIVDGRIAVRNRIESQAAGPRRATSSRVIRYGVEGAYPRQARHPAASIASIEAAPRDAESASQIVVIVRRRH